MEKRWLETLMTKEAVVDFGLDINKLIKVRRKEGTYYVFKEEIRKSDYEEINREDWKYQKRRQRDFEYLDKQENQVISIDASFENTEFEIQSDENLEDEAIMRLMIETLEEEIKNMPKEDRKLMELVFHTDLTQRELANILGVSVWKINKKIKKNKKILKNRLTKE